MSRVRHDWSLSAPERMSSCCESYNIRLFVAVTVDKGKQQAGEAGRQAHSGGKDETTPTTVPQSKVKVEPPSVEDVLRYPIEVFVSAGEPFIPAESEYSALHKMWYFICVHLWLLGVIFSLHTDKTAELQLACSFRVCLAHVLVLKLLRIPQNII